MKNDFERKAPESAGIPSRAILAYLEELQAENLCLHDVLIFHDEKLIYEGYWKPMNRDSMQRLYSCSKSFVSVAVGAAIGEGLISLDDKVNKFFPDKVPGNQHPWQAAATVRDLLRMSTGNSRGVTYSPADPDWADTWFRETPSHEPGCVFQYDTTATTMLCIIIKRATGKEFMEYLRERVFDKIGFDPEGKAWCVESPCGHQWGGSGVVCKPYDFARFAMFCMNYGNHNGEQLVPEWYMREATSKQIDIQHYSPNGNNDGYGYQFWTLPDGGFSFNGMGCQFAVCLPKKKLLLVTHGYEQLATVAKPLIIRAFLRGIAPWAGEEIEVNPVDAMKLREYTEGMKLVSPKGEIENPVSEKISGRRYNFRSNELGLEWMQFCFDGDNSFISYKNADGENKLRFSFTSQAEQAFPAPAPHGRRIGVPNEELYRCFTSAAWSERTCDDGQSDTLSVWSQICDIYKAQIRMTFAFGEDSITVYMAKDAEWFYDNYAGFATGKV